MRARSKRWLSCTWYCNSRRRLPIGLARFTGMPATKKSLRTLPFATTESPRILKAVQPLNRAVDDGDFVRRGDAHQHHGCDITRFPSRLIVGPSSIALFLIDG